MLYMYYLLSHLVHKTCIDIFSKTTGPYGKNLYRNVPFGDLIIICDFCVNNKFNIPARANKEILFSQVSNLCC